MSEQRLYLGAGSLRRIPEVLAGARRALLVTGRRSYAESGAARTIEPLLAGIEVSRFNEFGSNPVLEEVECGVAMWRRLRPQVVIAIGGGSVLDMAKTVNALAVEDAPPSAALTNGLAAMRPAPPLIAVPTTAGSGSEATHFATIYAGGVKHSLAHERLRPACAIVDPELSSSMPPQLTAATGLDALCQAIESYWAVEATQESQALAAEALSRLWPAIAAAVRTPDAAARGAMAHGAYLAGRAIDQSRTTAAHALSYALTTRFGVAHGHAVALTLGRLFELNARARALGVNDGRGVEYVERTLDALCALLGQPDAHAAARALAARIHSLGLATDLRSVGVAHRDIDGLVAAVNAERLRNHPVRLTPQSLRELLESLQPA
jgi:alcohol dehydrogenase class IV